MKPDSPCQPIAGHSFAQALQHACCTWAMTVTAPARGCNQRISTSAQYGNQLGTRLAAFDIVLEVPLHNWGI